MLWESNQSRPSLSTYQKKHTQYFCFAIRLIACCLKRKAMGNVTSVSTPEKASAKKATTRLLEQMESNLDQPSEFARILALYFEKVQYEADSIVISGNVPASFLSISLSFGSEESFKLLRNHPLLIISSILYTFKLNGPLLIFTFIEPLALNQVQKFK